MKHLQSFNELNKSTYLSASDKLQRTHPRRAHALITHATNKGTDARRERLYPHRFSDTKNGSDYYYFICECEISKTYKDSFSLKVKFESNWGKERDINLYPQFNIVDSAADLFRFRILEDRDNNIYFFEKRSDAFHFRKFLLEYLEDNKEEIKEFFPKFEEAEISINKIYAEPDRNSFKSEKNKKPTLSNFDLYYNKKSG